MFIAARISMLLALLLVAACAAGPRTEPAGVVEVGKLRVTIDDGWYRVPGDETPEKRSLTRVLTRQGSDTERLYIIAGTAEGETLFKTEHAGAAPAFNPGMSHHDIAEMVAVSLNGAMWGGAASFSSKIEEYGYTGIPGVRLELEFSGPASFRAVAGAFEVDERLHTVIYVAESPDVFERNQEAVQAIVDSAIYSIKTIRR